LSVTGFYVETLARIRTALSWLPGTVASVLVLVLAGVFALVLHRIVTNTFLRLPGVQGRFLRSFVKQVRRPLQLFFVIAAVVTALPVAGFTDQTTSAIGQILLVVFILLVGYSAVLAAGIAADSYLGRWAIDQEDNLVARKHTTQVRILKRAADILIALVTVAAALMTFEPVRQYGVSLFASAGAASLVVGLAARPLLTNLIAGVQIAVTQPIRIEDAVIVEGEWGWVEEITSTYVVVRLWDWRRMILPISYFLEKPFQNWTHSSASLIGSVFLFTDYRVPVERLREQLTVFAKASPLWDGKVVNLQVSDALEQSLQIRMLVSARNAPQAWDLRCEIREKMIGWIQAEMPEMLPRTRVELREAQGPASGPSSDRPPGPECIRPGQSP
jgi:small-conductance mechanosensitive channel